MEGVPKSGKAANLADWKTLCWDFSRKVEFLRWLSFGRSHRSPREVPRESQAGPEYPGGRHSVSGPRKEPVSKPKRAEGMSRGLKPWLMVSRLCRD